MSSLIEKLHKEQPLSVDEILYKEPTNLVQVFIKNKKEKFCKKSYLKIWKSKELWKIIKILNSSHNRHMSQYKKRVEIFF